MKQTAFNLSVLFTVETKAWKGNGLFYSRYLVCKVRITGFGHFGVFIRIYFKRKLLRVGFMGTDNKRRHGPTNILRQLKATLLAKCLIWKTK